MRRTTISVSKKAVFGGVTLMLVLVGIGCIEVFLRVTTQRPEADLVTTVTYDGITWHKLNRFYLKKYFSSSDVLVPELKDELFRVTRTPNSIRIFCLGESSMFGVPYTMTATIPAMVRKQLRALYPDREVEVINAAASAINSSVILEMAREITDLQPDLVLIYLGHNEFYGPGGVGASWTEKHLPFVASLGRAAGRLLVVQKVNALFAPSAAKPARELTLMHQVSNDTEVRLSSEDAVRIFRVYEANVRGIVEELRAHRIPVVFSDAASNLLFPPFKYDRVAGGAEEAIVQAFRDGSYAALETQLKRLSAADSTNAFVNFWLGRTELMLGSHDDARRSLIRAKDEDLLKFRAPERTNAILRSVCTGEGIPMLSSDSLLRAASPHGISDTALFWEHVHPNARGYYMIANLFVRTLLEHGLLPDPAGGMRPPLPFDRDSLSLCFLDLAFGDMSIRSLTSHWPFREYSVTPAVLGTADEELRDIVTKAVRSEYVRDEACYRSADHFKAAGDLREARRTYEAVLEEYPYNYFAHYQLGNLLNRIGDEAGALRHFNRAVASNPTFVYALIERGLTAVNFGRLDEALADFTEARRCAGQGDPLVGARISYGIALVYANRNDFANGLIFVDEALRLVPSYEGAIALRSRIIASRL